MTFQHLLNGKDGTKWDRTVSRFSLVEKKLGGGGGGGGDRMCHVTDTGGAREAGPVL